MRAWVRRLLGNQVEVPDQVVCLGIGLLLRAVRSQEWVAEGGEGLGVAVAAGGVRSQNSVDEVAAPSRVGKS